MCSPKSTDGKADLPFFQLYRDTLFKKYSPEGFSGLPGTFKFSSSIKYHNKIGVLFTLIFDSHELYRGELVSFMFFQNNRICLQPIYPRFNEILLFDFNLSIQEKINQKFVGKDIARYPNFSKREFTIILEDKFYDQDINEFVYKFRLENLGCVCYEFLNQKLNSSPRLEADDYMFFVAKTHGIIGAYICDRIQYSSDSLKEGFLKNSDIGNIYKNRYDYSKMIEMRLL